MHTRQPGATVYIAGDMRPMTVEEPDQYRDGRDRARRRYIKLRPEGEVDEPGRWWRSDVVTGG